MPGDIPLVELLRVLTRHGVEFFVVGGVAAVLNGAPITTFDLDIVHRRTPENVERLLLALREIAAIYRGDPRNLTPGPTHLLGPGHQLLSTKLGPLDVLGTIENDTTYEVALPDTFTLEIDGLEVRTLNLPRLIREKEFAARPKDLAVLPVLRATLAMLNAAARSADDPDV